MRDIATAPPRHRGGVRGGATGSPSGSAFEKPVFAGGFAEVRAARVNLHDTDTEAVRCMLDFCHGHVMLDEYTKMAHRVHALA